MLRTLRFPLFASLALLSLSPVLPVAAQTAQPVPKLPVQTADDPWLYKGSDLVHDDAWKFGRLSNGVRYAVRMNGVPPGQVSVRVRIDAGSLYEKDSERGFAHLLEHLSFRGSVYVPDGESKRIWQRLGVTFGSDSNASTTFTQTVYKLDLPAASREGLDESFKILSGMMTGPTLTQAALDAERPVVLAEAREQPGPQERMQDASLALAFAGQPLASRKPIGTTETLTGATAATVQAFHNRWYRPERATVIAIGDVDPAVLEGLIQKYFTDWKAEGPAEKAPDFGKPEADHPVAAAVSEPALQPMVSISIVRPWTVFADTVIFNQKRLIDLLATRIMSRRLESRARTGGTFLAAGVDLDDIGRSANVTSVQVLPVGDDWEKALKDVRSIIAGVQTTPPTQAEIDRELAEIEAIFKQQINTAPVEAGSKIGDNLVEAVDINETVTTPQASYDIFRAAIDAKMFTPASVQASAKRIFEGTATRALVNTRVPDPQAVAKVTAALGAPVVAAKTRAVGNVTFAQLPKLGAPGTVVSRTPLVTNLQIEQVDFSNGVKLILNQESADVGRVFVNVRFGRGLSAVPADKATPLWAGATALVASGIGTLRQEELDALTGNRQIGFSFGVGDDAFKFAAQTNKADLADQLKLFATKLAAPGWDPNPVLRAKTALLASYAGMSASPDAVLARDVEQLTHSGDPRFGLPSREVAQALTPAQFRAFWAPLLATGPIEVQVFGDIDKDATIKAVAETFGALKPRPAAPAPAANARFPAHVDKPVVRTHTGKEDQAAAVIAWPTGGGSEDIVESRKLEVLVAVFRDRLLDQLRSQAGVSYSPNISSQWPLGMDSGGKLIALGLVPPDKTDFFFQLARGIAADLVAKPIDADELNRALAPIQQQLVRATSSSGFFMQLTEGGTSDPKRIAAIPSIGRDYLRTTPGELQMLAGKYLDPAKDWTMVVVPEKK